MTMESGVIATVARARLEEAGFERDLALEAGVAPASLAADQVRVSVEACGVCHRDLIDREGRFPFLQLPVTPGHEGVGRVLEVGGAVRDFAVADRVGTMHRDACGACGPCREGNTSLCSAAAHVLGLLADGAYASEVVVPESALYPLPDSLPASEAAVLHCTFGTAWRCLMAAGLSRDTERGRGVRQRVLVTGANGGVGVAGVQIAARFGAEVIAVVRDERHVAFLEGLGAARVVVSRDGRFNDDVGGVCIALDCVGQPTFGAALRSLRVGGKLAVVGNVDPRRVELNVGYLIVYGLTILAPGGATRSDMAALLAEHAEQAFEVPIAAELPLDRADEAQRRVRAGGLEGRIVLRPSASAERVDPPKRRRRA